MRKFTLLIAVGVPLIGLGLVGHALDARALPSPNAGAVTPAIQVQPTSTPAAPEDTQSILSRAPSPPAAAGMPERTRSEMLIEQPVRDDARTRQVLQLAQVVHQAGVRFEAIDPGVESAGSVSPQSPSETCVDILVNPQMDVVEIGGGQGYADPWEPVAQQIYYSTEEYNSAAYSLVMIDELDGSDQVGIIIDGIYRDYDSFGQVFLTPRDLTYLRASFHRMFINPDPGYDFVFSMLWALDSEGYLDELIGAVEIDPSSYPSNTWQGFYWELSSTQLITASNQSLALLFTMISDQVFPGEWMYLDDAQVTLCYHEDYTVYLPITVRQPSAEPPSPTCTPYEPDSLARRGSTTVGATCSGLFSQTDLKDYYSLNLNGVTNVRLRLFDLPSGTNWDALVYEDTSGYPLACHIGTPGDQDKHKDCTLNLSKDYFVMVNTGTAPIAGANTYKMSVEQR